MVGRVEDAREGVGGTSLVVVEGVGGVVFWAFGVLAGVSCMVAVCLLGETRRPFAGATAAGMVPPTMRGCSVDALVVRENAVRE